MDSREILSKVVNAIVQGDDEVAAQEFKQYATLKTKSLIAGDEPQADEVEEVELEVEGSPDDTSEVEEEE